MPNFFDDHSPFLNHPLLTAERSSAEVDQLIPLLGIESPGKVLDLGCGFGRHSIEFARRGFLATGIDPSPAMINAAERRATEAHIDGIAFGTSLDDLDGPFDAAVAMFTTVGQVGNDGSSNEDVVEHVAQLLRPNASFVVEVPQRDATVAQLVEHDEFGSGDNRTQITRRYHDASRRVYETFVVVTEGVQRHFDLAYRLFDRNELDALLTKAGFENIAFTADLAGTPLTAADPTMVAIACRPA